MTILNVYLISDSSGDTAQTVAKTAISQFPGLQANYSRYPFTRAPELLTGILKMAKKDRALIIHTLMKRPLAKQVVDFCKTHGLQQIDPLNPSIDAIAHETGMFPAETPGLIHRLNDTYFDRISAIEFAVQYDDGKNPKGLLKADIVLIGVSRTSKTPLSLFLANQNYKVANLPLVPNAKIPDELWEVPANRIVGLTTTSSVLNRVRRERMIAYGMDPDTGFYSDQKNINQELQYADEIFKKIGCLVINTAHKSIEETATLITNGLQIKPKI